MIISNIVGVNNEVNKAFFYRPQHKLSLQKK